MLSASRNWHKIPMSRALPLVFVVASLVASTSVAQTANFDLAERFTQERMDKMVGSTSLNATLDRRRKPLLVPVRDA